MSRRHWCRVSCRSVSPRVRNPSFFLVVVRICLVIVNSHCSHNYCLLHMVENGSFEVLSSQMERPAHAKQRACHHIAMSSRPWECTRPNLGVRCANRDCAANRSDSPPLCAEAFVQVADHVLLIVLGVRGVRLVVVELHVANRQNLNQI